MRGNKPDIRRMIPVILALGLAKRVGLARPMTQLAMKRMLSPEAKAEAFAGYEPTEHDVFVATFGKSGTNWMMQIAQQTAWLGHADFEHIHDVVPWPDAPFPLPLTPFDPNAEDAPPTGLRVIKTHLDTRFVPYDERATYLTVLRDPKEVVVSAYFFLGGLLGILQHVSIDEWHELFVGPGGMAETWALHTAGFWSWRNRPNVLVLNYGEIIREPVPSIERVAQTMGVKLDDTQRDEVVARSSFAYMKEHESQFAPPLLPFTKPEDRPKMVRKGEAGSSDEMLDATQQAEVDRACRAALERIGSDFPYDEEFPG